MKEQLFGLAVAMIAVALIVPVVMLIPGREFMVGILPYTLPMLLLGAWLLRVSMQTEATSPHDTDETNGAQNEAEREVAGS